MPYIQTSVRVFVRSELFRYLMKIQTLLRPPVHVDVIVVVCIGLRKVVDRADKPEISGDVARHPRQRALRLQLAVDSVVLEVDRRADERILLRLRHEGFQSFWRRRSVGDKFRVQGNQPFNFLIIGCYFFLDFKQLSSFLY